MQRFKLGLKIAVLVGVGLISSAPFTVAAPVETASEKALPLLLEDDFEQDFKHWETRWKTTDPNPKKPFWKIKQVTTEKQPNRVLRVLGKSNYQPPHRSPASIALLKDVCVSDFELRVKLQSTNKNAGPHRDLCLFWGYQDAAHFYYVHLGAKSDPHACQIFIVNGAPRVKITTQSASGTPWTDGWHDVKIVRNVESGLMEVYFDDMDKPLMVADDKTFAWGQVGLGTFDDHGNFDDFRLLGKRVSRPAEQELLDGEAGSKEKLTAKDTQGDKQTNSAEGK